MLPSWSSEARADRGEVKRPRGRETHGKERDQEAVGDTGRETPTDIAQRGDFRVVEVSASYHRAECRLQFLLEYNQRTPALSHGPFL